MKRKNGICIHWLLWPLVVLLAFPPMGIMAQGSDPAGPMTFRQEELDQMLAPIALYPDDLLSQVLMAATYPLEVVQAARWVQTNPNLKGDQLATSLEEKPWDPSVKSLVNFPTILQMMNDRLEWMGMLGDAFLAQQEQVMDTIQKLRQRARAQGSLMTTNEQRVILEPQDQTIIIAPAMPEVIYVPVYDPMIVYGPWWWPAYPPFFYHHRGIVVPTGFIGFGFGVSIGVPWGYAWGGFDWRHHRAVVNITRNGPFNNRIDRNRYASRVTTGSSGQGAWSHDPDHRRGVAYRTPAMAQQFGRGPLPGVEARRGFRGYDRPVTGGNFPPRTNRPEVQPSRVTPGLSGVKPESFRQPSLPAQEPRITPGQRAARSEPTRQFSTPVEQPRVTPTPMPTRPESFRQPPVSAQEPQTTPRPRVARPEPDRQLFASVQQPRIPPSPIPARPEMVRQLPGPGRQGVQGLQGPTAFSGVGPGGQTRQDSHRGHESLARPRSAGPGPGGNRPVLGGGHQGGGPSGGHAR